MRQGARGSCERALERTEPIVNVPPTARPEIESTISLAERTSPWAASSIWGPWLFSVIGLVERSNNSARTSDSSA